jgi:hypothetical protein
VPGRPGSSPSGRSEPHEPESQAIPVVPNPRSLISLHTITITILIHIVALPCLPSCSSFPSSPFLSTSHIPSLPYPSHPFPVVRSYIISPSFSGISLGHVTHLIDTVTHSFYSLPFRVFLWASHSSQTTRRVPLPSPDLPPLPRRCFPWHRVILPTVTHGATVRH